MAQLFATGIGAVLLFLAGLGAGFLLGRNRVREAVARASDAEAKLAEYRREVTTHFSRTAEHFRALGRQYRELYLHLAEGAGALCDTNSPGRLAFEPASLEHSETDFEPAAAHAVLPRDFAEGDGDDDAPETSAEPVSGALTAGAPESEPVASDGGATGKEGEAAQEVKSDAEVDPATRTYH